LQFIDLVPQFHQNQSGSVSIVRAKEETDHESKPIQASLEESHAHYSATTKGLPQAMGGL
jgi:hypothetical protein